MDKNRTKFILKVKGWIKTVCNSIPCPLAHRSTRVLISPSSWHPIEREILLILACGIEEIGGVSALQVVSFWLSVYLNHNVEGSRVFFLKQQCSGNVSYLMPSFDICLRNALKVSRRYQDMGLMMTKPVIRSPFSIVVVTSLAAFRMYPL